MSVRTGRARRFKALGHQSTCVTVWFGGLGKAFLLTGLQSLSRGTELALTLCDLCGSV